MQSTTPHPTKAKTQAGGVGAPWNLYVTLTFASPAWLFEEARQVIRHGWNEQAAIQKQVPHFAACFSIKEASMAGRSVGRTITAPVVRFMIRANWIVRANPQAFQGAPEDMRKSGSGCYETTERPLGTRARGVDQNAAAVDIAARSGSG